ncbi:hypothetical protein [Algoriphagus confluentis]|uniref:Lipoprotein n=1 Tax=Algoriphagus confluentis TaxID=1697556 RepID=A0ABQ6PIW1_9BACT|nr:hypothetical protein Aconfl_05290 [Algoriphagus confluentis]
MIYFIQRTTGLLSILLLIQACQLFEKENEFELLLLENFEGEEILWEEIFADYDYFQKDRFQFQFKKTSLPSPLNTAEPALMISSFNVSDDVFMGAKRKVGGLKKNRRYQISYEITFASNEPLGI